MTNLLARECFAREIVGARIEAAVDEVGVHSEEVLHLATFAL